MFVSILSVLMAVEFVLVVVVIVDVTLRPCEIEV